MSAGAEQTTLYERIGGQSAVAELIDRFYSKVVADPQLAPFFAHTSLDKLRSMQREFFSAALDGPQTYSGLSLAQAHEGRGISSNDFSRYVGHLLETLNELGLPQRDIMAVVDRIATYAGEITGQSNEAG